MTEPEETRGTAEPVDVGPRRVDFPCDNCGAKMTWDPAADALSCEYCQTRQPVPRGEGTIVERALDDVGDAARGFGLEVRVTKCANCGARVTFEGTSTAECCVYCGSSNVLSQEANRNALRPESLVPLDVCKDQVEKSFRKWIDGLWFRPNALREVKRFDAVGVYVPFWTFDCEVESHWSADAGYDTAATETYTAMVDGKPQVRTRQVRKVRWVPAWGDRRDSYDDHLVLASRGLPSDLMRELGDYDTTQLVPYQPQYLAGWRAEEYEVDLEDGWARGLQDVVASQRRRCSGDVPGDTQRNLRVKNNVFDVRWKHVLLPVWSLQYTFKQKTYTVLVHGQNGNVVGKAPLSWLKIAGLVVALGTAAAVVALVAGGR